jgi:hypothetical protein
VSEALMKEVEVIIYADGRVSWEPGLRALAYYTRKEGYVVEREWVLLDWGRGQGLAVLIRIEGHRFFNSRKVVRTYTIVKEWLK